MKRLILSLVMVICSTLALNALSYSDARREAWFLTDKMAYELNLTPHQCDVIYQINLDYFLSIRYANDCRGSYWYFRDDDFRCVLYPWQYSMYIKIDYFYYPISWVHSSWYYPVCRHYTRGYYYFDHPTVYVSYTGSSWSRRTRSSHSPYRNVSFRSDTSGMRDRYYRGSTDRRPTYRPEYERPSSHNSTRPSREYGDRNNTNSVETRPTRPSRTDINNDRNNSRPSRSDIDRDRNNRPSRNEGYQRPDRSNGGHSSGFQNASNGGNNSYRPSREVGRDHNTGNRRTETRETPSRVSRPDSPSRSGHGDRPSRNTSHERPSRSGR